jgi:outer membrane protein W
MKKLSLLFLALFCFFSFSANAQFHGGATLGLQAPIGDFSDGANMGFGINLNGKYMFKENMAVGLNLGYNRFGAEISDVSFSMIPVTGLFEYHFGGDAIKPYVGADLGIYSFGVKWKFDGESSSDSELHFGLSPVVGILYDLKENLKLCANIKMHNIFADGQTLSWFGINAGVIIPFN